ncbi:MAG: hypothetical protein JRI81_16030, partial [Deltaproteobacteria bacterium]|nr:hypothetical protein [Deltaproteobacteria bacterium]
MKPIYITLAALLTVLFLLCAVCEVHAEDVIRIDDFSGGLNTKAGLFHIKPNQARECLNWDLSDEYGALKIRNGYCKINNDTIPGIEPIYGLYGYTNRAGEKYLFGITPRMSVDSADSHFVGLGELQVSDAFGYSFDTANPVYEYIYTGTRPSWATWKDMVFMSNGRQRPIVWTDGYGRDLIVQTPGEPRSYVMNDRPYWGASDSSGPNGEYYYMVKTMSLCGGSLSQKMPDPDLEAWSDDSTLTYWTEYEDIGNGIFVSKDSDNEKSGTYCAKIEAIFGGMPNPAYKHGLKDTIDVDTLTDYTFGAYVKFDTSVYTSLAPGYNFLEVYINSIPEEDAGGEDRENPGIVAHCRVNDTTDAWQKMELSFTTTLIDSLEIKFNYYADTCILYLDSVNLFSITDASFRESYITQPLIAFNEKIMHKDFVFHTVDTLCDSTDNCWDDITLELYRTRAYPGNNIDDLDTFFRIDYRSNITKSVLDTLRLIDSIPDDSLGSGTYATYSIRDKDKIGRNADKTISGFRVGAPTFVGANEVAGSNCLPPGDTIAGMDNLALVYAMTYEDTITNFESDGSRYLFIWYDSNSTDTNFRIGLPPIPGGQDHLIRKLYKAYAYSSIVDTSAGNTISGYDTLIRYVCFDRDVYGHDIEHCITDTIISERFNLDTNISPFYQLAAIKDSAIKTFIDTISWDSLSHPSRALLKKSSAPTDLNNITAFNDRLWGISRGSRLRWSRLDTASVWNIFEDIALNLDDGDQVTAVVPMRDYIKVYKNNSQFTIYWESGRYSRNWTVQGVGCIAPYTMTHYGNGLIYLSNQGVMRETGNVYKDKGSNYEIIST